VSNILKQTACKERGERVRYLLYGFWVVACIIIVRLFYLQIENRFVFSTMGEKNFLRMEVISPLRGDVYDCNHVQLAANRPVFDLYWYGTGKGKLTATDEQMLQRLSKIMGTDFLVGQQRLDIEYAMRYAHRLLLKTDVSFDQLCQISEQCSGNQHLVVKNRFKRVYPHQMLASHVLGYLSKADNVGKSGIECKFESSLQGQEGYVVQMINATGKTLQQKDYKPPQAGLDLSLTLDIDLQKLSEAIFEPGQAGAFILMDPEDGAVKALVSFPNFDPNMFLRPISEDEWNDMSQSNPLLNRATTSLFPPASTFKLVTVAAGLDDHVITPESEFFCSGYTSFCGRRYNCMQHLGHGRLTPKQALAVSCNVLCFQIAKRVKIDRIAWYATQLGLGRKTGFLLPERDGIVPSTVWKKTVKGERWWKGETLSTSIGQSYLLVTPLQIARMVSAICTGHLVKPRLLLSEEIVKAPVAITPATLAFLRSSMREAVLSGTVHRLGMLGSLFDVRAKTGTAQTCSLSQEPKKTKNQLEHAWVAGYFTYKGQRPLTFIVFLEHSGSSSFALDSACKFLRSYHAYMSKKDAVQTVT